MRAAAATRRRSARCPGGAGSRAAGIASATAAKATTAKTSCGPSSSAALPSTGPSSAPAIAAASGVPITSPRRSAGARSTTQAKPAAHVQAADSPWTKRATSSSKISPAKPNARLDTARPASPRSVVGFTPQRPASQPAGIAATRFPAA